MKRKKVPSDYPQMIFRVSQTDKDRLHELIDGVTDLSNRKKREEGRPVFRKNDIIVDALYLGLLTLERRLKAR